MTTFKMLTAAFTIAASALTGLAATANAGDWNRGGRGHGYGHGGSHGYYAPAPRHYYAPSHGRRDNRGNKIAAGIAIGVGAAIIGSIIANEARRNNHYHGY